MRNLIFAKAMFLVLSFSLFARDRGLNQNDDFQVWLYQSYYKELKPKTTFFLDGEIRYGDHGSKAYLTYLQAILIFRISSFFSCGPGYRHVYRYQQSLDNWTFVYEPFADFLFEKKVGRWRIKDRNRLAYLFRQTETKTWHYRNRLSLISPWMFGTMKFNPQFSDEVFFEKSRGFFENRFAVGGGMKLSKNIQSNIFYILRHIRRDHWLRQHILNLQVNYTF